jgi:hypothetical protein
MIGENMIKKSFGFLSAFLILISLAACSTVNSLLSSTQTDSASAQSSQVSEEDQLLIGTLKLEGTGQAVTAQQAGELLPLWKAVKSLGSSDTTSPVEIQALYDQIRETMTAEQLNTIDGIDLSAVNMREIMQGLGIQSMAGGSQRSSEDGTSSSQSQGGNNNRQGGGDDGMRPMDGGGGGGPPPEFNNRSLQTTRTTTSTGGGLSARLLDPLLELLKKRAAQT